MTPEEAEQFILYWLRTPSAQKSGFATYGYGVYLPNIIRDFLLQGGKSASNIEHEIPGISPHFYAAAWELCRRGILRPGIQHYGNQATADGASGNGYSITPFGRKWLEESNKDDFVPTEPGRFAQMLEPYRDNFGPQFYERAQEAVRCYGAHTYLACCVMSGAAAESILLAAAIKKSNEEDVLKSYNSARGRITVENLLIGQAREQLARDFRGFLTLLKYWRDNASHGAPSRIKDNEAFTSLALLLRFAALVQENWEELTARKTNSN